MTQWFERRFELEQLLDPRGTLERVRDRIAAAAAPRLVRKWARTVEERTALERERAALLRLAHDAIRDLRASSDGEPEGIVLEEALGLDLAQHLARHPGDLRACAVQLLRVLVHLHGRGMLHGDLKPGNVIVERTAGGPRVRLIDLGLVAAIGGAVPGGTPDFLAPEYRHGAPGAVAGDLFAFGGTLRAVCPRASDPDLQGTIDRCLEEDPGRRPASADAALAGLGAGTAAIDRLGELPRLGGEEIVRACDDLLSAGEGGTIVVEGEAAAGRSRLVRDVRRHAIARRLALADASLAGGHDPLLAIGALLVPRSPVERDAAAVAAAVAAAREGIALCFDDADASSEDVRQSLPGVVRALAAIGKGALVVVGADAALAADLVAAGARPHPLPALDGEALRVLARAHGLAVDPATLDAAVRGAGGRAGAIGRTIRALLERPETSVDEAAEIAAAARRQPPPPDEASGSPLSVDEALARARDDLVLRAGLRAARRLRAAVPGIDDDPGRHPEVAELLAQAERVSGRLDRASAVLETLGDEITAEARLDRARLSERLGRAERAAADAGALLADGPATLRGAAAVVAATATLALGRPDEASRLLDAGAAATTAGSETAVRLETVRSDVALLRGDARQALEHGRAAEAAARILGDAGLLALALSRIGAAHALGDDPSHAREAYSAALDAIRQSGDVGGLPAYLVNLATADHAIGELGSAIARYEEAARMAERLGRRAIRAAALTNLAGLLVTAGAHDEARRVLADARREAVASGAAIYEAQTSLVEAEIAAGTSAADARGLAEHARDAFLACGAGRQALEAELLLAEIAEGEGAGARATAFCIARGASLEQAGLGPRGRLLEARAALVAGDLETARRAADSAANGARDQGDRALEGRALRLLAAVHEQLGTGAETALRARAREAVGEAAARLPPGLRERFLAAPEQRSLARSAPADEDAPRSVGLDPRARRLLALVRRVLLEGDEQRLLEAAVDEAVELTRAERAFLLARRPNGRTAVVAARNFDRETIRRSRFRYSRSVAERVLSTAEPLVTASAVEDPLLQGARSVLDLGLRSILCVPVRGPSGVAGALYLDNRFSAGHFTADDGETVQSLADIIGMALENARLHRESADRARALVQAHEAVSRENALRGAEVERLAQALARVGPDPRPVEGGIVGSSALLLRAVDVARRVAPSDLPVLILGESGTGKELIARFVHDHSLRAAGPFVAINCGALPEGLLESELFGHVRGAFTGATRDHSGLFRTAAGGTLLLDEIGELPLRMQTRLLRVLQEQEVQPVGGGAPIRVDVRVLAATNRDLGGEVEEGRFRRDLFFRLLGVRVDLPPLRARKEDLPALAEAALDRIAREPGMRRARLRRETLGRLAMHDWPGNVRELEQTLRRAVLIAETEEIGPEDLDLGGGSVPRRAALRRYDRSLVEQALRGARGNRTAAARALGVSRVTLHRWIRRYDL